MDASLRTTRSSRSRWGPVAFAVAVAIAIAVATWFGLYRWAGFGTMTRPCTSPATPRPISG